MAAGADKFSRLGRKPSGGAFIWLLGANAAHGAGDGLRAGLARPSRQSRPSDIQVPNPVGQRCAPSPLAETVCITCNTYSVPYKGKDLKKRLSPKSVNTLIHQCITFYIFLIFQYLSLWKSVFSCN